MASIEAAIITASASVIVASLSYFFAKKREVEADWRKKNLNI